MTNWENKMLKSPISDLGRCLVIDLVISLGQCQRWFGLGEGDLRGTNFILVRRKIGLTAASSSPPQLITFICLNKKVARYHSATLRHFAGLAGIRRELGARGEDWYIGIVQTVRSDYLSSRKGKIQHDAPDASWFERTDTPDVSMVTAVEYDASSHRCSILSDKMIRYDKKSGKQIWGASTPHRCEKILELFTEVLPNGNFYVVCVEWW